MPNIYDILRNRTNITYETGEDEEEVNEGSVVSRYTNALQQFNENNQSDDQGQANGAGTVLANNRRKWKSKWAISRFKYIDVR